MEFFVAIVSASAGFLMGMLAFWMIDEHATAMAKAKTGYRV